MNAHARNATARQLDDDALTELLLAAQQGNQWKLATFIRHTQSSVHRLVSYLGATGEADDLTQDTYIRAMRALPAYNNACPARHWLMSIARRVAADSVRSRQRRQRLSKLIHSARPSEMVANLETTSEVSQMLTRLDHDRRSAFVLTQLLGYSYEDAAAICDCAIGTIRSRVARARGELVEVWNASDR